MMLKGRLAGAQRHSTTAARAVPLRSTVPACAPSVRRVPIQPALAPQQLQQRWVASRVASVEAPSRTPPREEVFTQDPANNVTDYIYEKMGKNLHQRPAHPIGIIKEVCVCHSHATSPPHAENTLTVPAGLVLNTAP